MNTIIVKVCCKGTDKRKAVKLFTYLSQEEAIKTVRSILPYDGEFYSRIYDHKHKLTNYTCVYGIEDFIRFLLNIEFEIKREKNCTVEGYIIKQKFYKKIGNLNTMESYIGGWITFFNDLTWEQVKELLPYEYVYKAINGTPYILKRYEFRRGYDRDTLRECWDLCEIIEMKKTITITDKKKFQLK